MTSTPPDDLRNWRACFTCGHFSQPPDGPDCLSCSGAPWERSRWCEKPGASALGRAAGLSAPPGRPTADARASRLHPQRLEEEELHLDEALGLCGVGPRKLPEHPAPERQEEPRAPSGSSRINPSGSLDESAVGDRAALSGVLPEASVNPILPSAKSGGPKT